MDAISEDIILDTNDKKMQAQKNIIKIQFYSLSHKENILFCN